MFSEEKGKSKYMEHVTKSHLEMVTCSMNVDEGATC